MQKNILNIIIPFFTFNNSDQRITNLKNCIKYLSTYDNIHITLIHGVYNNKDYLENEKNFLEKNKVLYLKYNLESPIWIKENLINLAIKNLNNDWEYVAWIDADIIFLNNNWVNETLEKLKIYDVLQLFNYIIFLNNKNNFDLEASKFDAFHKTILKGFVSLNWGKGYNDYSSTGFGWAITKNFYRKINHLFEFNIIGGGDFIFAIGATNSYNNEVAQTSPFFKRPPSNDFKNELLDHLYLFKDAKVCFINGLIAHLWHGDLKQRKYQERLEILVKHNYTPTLDLIKNNEGVLKLSKKNSLLENDILNYFKERND